MKVSVLILQQQWSFSRVIIDSMQNILVTSAGKRVVLVELFKRALKACDQAAKVYTTDLNPELAPAGIASDKCFRVPRVLSSDYISILLNLSLIHI